jgi:hypothetical protein
VGNLYNIRIQYLDAIPLWMDDPRQRCDYQRYELLRDANMWRQSICFLVRLHLAVIC